MSLNFELRRRHHAIGEFTASLDFFQPIGAATFASVAETLTGIAGRHDLPARVPVQIVEFKLGPNIQHLVPSEQASLTGALGFQRFSKEGEIVESIACEANAIKYNLRDYTVWEDVLPKLKDIFSELVLEYIKEVPAVQSIRLQYLNEFISPKNVEGAAELFRKGSRWVAPLAYDSEEALHSHVGIYLPRRPNERNLVNVNCDVGIANSDKEKYRFRVKVIVMAGCYFNVPGQSPLIVSKADVAEVLASKFDEAHALEKRVLREVISDPYLQAMGANDVD